MPWSTKKTSPDALRAIRSNRGCRSRVSSLLLGLEGVQEQFHDLAVRIAMATPPEPPEKRKAIFDARDRLLPHGEQGAPMR